MRAHHIMTRDVITVTPHTGIEDAANIMLRTHISGLPVMDDAGQLVGIVSESDFLRRSEIGTGRKRAKWLQFLMGPGWAASDFVHERGRKVEDVMTQDPVTVGEETPLEDLVRLMEKNDIKRLPVLSGKRLVGIVTRSNLLLPWRTKSRIRPLTTTTSANASPARSTPPIGARSDSKFRSATASCICTASSPPTRRARPRSSPPRTPPASSKCTTTSASSTAIPASMWNRPRT